LTGKTYRSQGKTFIGPVQNPIWIGEKTEVAGLFNEQFYYCLNIWEKLNLGWGWPNGLPWGEQDPDLVDIMVLMQNYYNRLYSNEAAIVKHTGETAAYAKVTAQGKRIKD
jgi:hypothetical protein